MTLSHFIHYKLTKNFAENKLAKRLGFDTIEDVYNSFGNKLEERKNFEKAVEAYSDAYADLQNSFNFSLLKNMKLLQKQKSKIGEKPENYSINYILAEI